MGRQHGVVPQPGEQGFRIVLKDGERVGIQHQGNPGLRECADRIGGFHGHARSGADQCSRGLALGDDTGQFARRVVAANHDRGQMGGMDERSGGFRQHRDKPRTGPERAPRAEPGGTAGQRAAADHKAVAALVFMGVPGRPGEMIGPQVRCIEHDPGTDRLQNARRNADIDHMELPAQSAPGIDPVARLGAEEGDGLIGHNGRAAHLPRIAIDAAGHIDRHHMAGRCIDGVDQRRRGAVNRPGQSGTEQGVDDDIGTLENQRIGRLHRARPARRRQGRIAREGRRIADQR